MKIQPLKPCADKPCNDCPMRRKSMPGWLGEDTPEGFIQMVHADTMAPCHLTVDYDGNWELQLVQGKASACAGIAIYFSNIAKVSRDPARRRLPPDHKTVFSSPMEFLAHHNKLKKGSR